MIKENTPSHLAEMYYRPDIDGLRALAVIAVVIFHAFPNLLQGGFVGVDVFFVISGFLITTIILRNLENEAFSFTDFYLRRMIRIFPALILVLLTSLIFGWYALLPSEFDILGMHVLAGAGFVQNIVLNSEAGYFDVGVQLKPLLHLWSLAIEEQFYLFYPLLLWMVWFCNLKNYVLKMMLLLGVLSFLYNIYLVKIDPSSTFF